MKLSGENKIPASREVVWQALNDPDVLRRAIPGCESLEKLSDTAFKATVGTKIGPVQAKFNGQVELSDLDPPNGYTISGSGSGGMAGNAKGAAKVRLEEDGENSTRLIYDVDAQVTGKLAQLGSRLIDSTAKMLAGQFFNRFEKIVASENEDPGATASTSNATPAATATPTSSAAAAPSATTANVPSAGSSGAGAIPGWMWIVIIGAFVVFAAWYFTA